MADNDTALPEGTDSIIAGASKSGEENAAVDTPLVEEIEIPAPSGVAERPVVGSGSAEGGLEGSGDGGSSPEGSLSERFRSGREKLSSQAGDRARGLLGQGLERSAEALANVGRMVGDTATGIDDRLGNEYGDYARRAAGAIENAANSIASKDPDELIDDARTFVRNSPGIALAGAAVVGFVVARLVKSGLATSRGGDDDDDRD